MRLSVFGTGYVGLVAAACFADKGNDVVCVDIDHNKVARLRAGETPIYEPGLTELLARNKDRLRFTTDAAEGVRGAAIIFIAVGTPQRADGLGADTSLVEAVAREVATHADAASLLVIKSTVPVGTAARVKQIVARSAHPITVVSNPEFQKEGDAVRDFEIPDRVVVGTNDPHARDALRELYEPFFRRSDRLLFMSNESAELTKYGANTMLAARISLMNELSRVADACGADIADVRAGIGTDNRIGTAFLFPGPGYGGSCFPKDVRELIATTKRYGVAAPLISAVDGTNEEQKRFVAAKVHGALGQPKGKRVALWGVTYKARTDDIRTSAALVVIDGLLAGGASVSVYDPEGLTRAREQYGTRIDYGTQYGCLEGADCLVIMTDWNEFKTPDFARMRSAMRTPRIVDARNLLQPGRCRKEGFTYSSIGRP